MITITKNKIAGVIELHIELTPQEALDYAQFLKRVGYNNYRENAVNEAEAYRMIEVGEKIREKLAQAGIAPR